jgi:ADP-ribosylglycohydrolase
MDNKGHEELLKKIKAVLFGVAVGDALGVPVEFMDRHSISLNPVKEMTGFGTYHLPPGTFSDDSSLTFCLCEALAEGYDLRVIGQSFVKWYFTNYWTPRGEVFDIGITTKNAIERLAKGVRPDLAGDMDVSSNGNGSLMRIAPLVFEIQDRPIHERFEIIKQVSSITHGHMRSVIGCFYYLEYARQLLLGSNKFEVYANLQVEVADYLTLLGINPNEIALFGRLLNHDISELPEEKIFSTGYVLHTLEASIWCLLTTNSYEAAVLKAVNLGEDSDTTGAVTGGLAGLLYGFDSIPNKWVAQIARYKDIENLAERLCCYYSPV